jgi:hypothetical protein
MKRTLALILTAVMILAVLPMAAFADSSAPADGVLITIDGVLYHAQQGEIIDYVYYLCTGEQLCSLEGELYFSPDGLELVPEETEDLSLSEQIFPKIGSAIVTNLYEPGTMAFNFSSAMGVKFAKETNKLIQTQFRVIAASGSYELKTTLDIVCGAEEKKYIFKGETINPLPRHESDVTNMEPYNPDATEPAPTEAPTDPPTEAPTEPPTVPAPRVLTDPATGVTVEHETADSLSVTPITLGDLNCYISDFENFTVYDIALMKDGAAMILDEPVKVTVPAPAGAGLYTLGDLTYAAVDASYADGRLVFADKALGVFAVSADGTAPVMTLYGNVDGDRDITVVDATHIQRSLAGIESFTADQKRIGDTDGDGVMTIVDATYIQRWLAGLSSALDRFNYPRKSSI